MTYKWKIIENTLDKEVGNKPNGGYTNDPVDKGGETKWGITVAVARAFGYKGRMIDLPKNTAMAIYDLKYWRTNSLDEIESISDIVAAELYDTGVNMGIGIAAKFLQKTLNISNNNQKDFPDIVVDGKIGDKTIACLKSYFRKRKDAEKIIVFRLNAFQDIRYDDIIDDNQSQERFGNGWRENRVVEKFEIKKPVWRENRSGQRT